MMRSFSFFRFWGKRASAAIQKLKNLRYQLTPRRVFRLLPFARKNVGLILSLPPGVYLCQKKGILQTCSKRKWVFCNALLFGCAAWKVRSVIRDSFLVFFHELYNPVNIKGIKAVMQRKKRLFTCMMQKLQTHGFLYYRASYGIYWDRYMRKSYLQIRVVHRAEKALARQKGFAFFYIQALQGLADGACPLLYPEGSSGSYILSDKDARPVALFKPYDEEAHGPHNPHGLDKQGPLAIQRMRNGLRVGENMHREVAAYVVDRYLGLGIVPATVYAELHHWAFYPPNPVHSMPTIKRKIGSLQNYIPSGASYRDQRDSEQMLAQFPALVLLDAIIGNLDRHFNNLLVEKGRIWAIDNGLSFPESHAEVYSWQWASLPVAEQPFPEDFLTRLEKAQNASLEWRLKKNCQIDEDALQCMRERLALLKAAVRAKYLPWQVAVLMQGEHLLKVRYATKTLPAKAQAVVENARKKIEKRGKKLLP